MHELGLEAPFDYGCAKVSTVAQLSPTEQRKLTARKNAKILDAFADYRPPKLKELGLVHNLTVLESAPLTKAVQTLAKSKQGLTFRDVCRQFKQHGIDLKSQLVFETDWQTPKTTTLQMVHRQWEYSNDHRSLYYGIRLL